MKALPIRTWLALALVAIGVVPLLTMAIVAGLSWWHAPFWHTMPDGPRAVGPGYYWGSADRPGPPWPWLLVPLSGFVALLLTLIGVAWFLGRSVLKPLAAMSQAARQIAAGDLDFQIPASQVREVAEVRAAFQAMGDELRGSIERQAELEEERRFFVSAIAHDLRTPLFSLRGYLEGLERGLAISPKKVAQYIAVCRRKSDQLDRLVSDLFAYTKTEYLEQTLRRERLELGSVLEQAVDGLQPRAQAKGIEVALEGPDDRGVLEGDAHLLERVVENLLDNALRHTPAKGSIAVRWHTEPDRVTFTVADSGAGIAAEDLPHLFDPLYRGDASRNPETGGVGLGLTIARRILRAHGGDLVAANGASGGAAFTGAVPRMPVPRRERAGTGTAFLPL
jgi:signal transduction histidine kinase